MGQGTGRGRRRADQAAHRQGRQHGDGAARVGAQQLAARPLRQQARGGRQLQAHGHLRHGAGQHRRGQPGRGLAQPVRTGLRRGAGQGQRRHSPVLLRDARGHGRPCAPGPAGDLGRRAPVRAGGGQGRVHQRHRLPDPPAGREHRPGEFPPLRPGPAGRLGRVALPEGRVPGRLPDHGHGPGPAQPHPGPHHRDLCPGGLHPAPQQLCQRAGHRLVHGTQPALGGHHPRPLDAGTGERAHADSAGHRRCGDPC